MTNTQVREFLYRLFFVSHNKDIFSEEMTTLMILCVDGCLTNFSDQLIYFYETAFMKQPEFYRNSIRWGSHKNIISNPLTEHNGLSYFCIVMQSCDIEMH